MSACDICHFGHLKGYILVSSRRGKICILFISKYLYIYQCILFSKFIICLLLNKLTLRHKSGVYLYNSKYLKILLKFQWIFDIFLSLFVIRNFRRTCSSIKLLEYMVRDRSRTPALNQWFGRFGDQSTVQRS